MDSRVSVHLTLLLFSVPSARMELSKPDQEVTTTVSAVAERDVVFRNIAVQDHAAAVHEAMPWAKLH